MDWTEACTIWATRMAVNCLAAAILTFCIDALTPLPELPLPLTLTLCAFFATRKVVVEKRASNPVSKRVHQKKLPSDPVSEQVQQENQPQNPLSKRDHQGKPFWEGFWEAYHEESQLWNSFSKRVHQEKKPSDPVPKCVHQEVTEVKERVDKLEQLLQGYGCLIEDTGTECLQVFKQIYKEQRDHLKQFNDFRKQYSGQLGFIVNVLEGHRNDIAEASRAAKENNITLCNIIGQYRQIVEDNQKLVKLHVEVAASALDKTITSSPEHVDAPCDSTQETLHSHTQLIEHNRKLIQEHGVSIDNVVADHATLAAEYQAAMDGLALLMTANRVFSLVQKPAGWETLGDSSEEVDGINHPVEDARRRLAQNHNTLVNRPESGIAAASMVENVHELSRVFREASKDVIRSTDGKPERMALAASIISRENHSRMVEHPDWQLDTDDGMAQMMATVFNQLQDTAQTMVDTQHAEEMEQLRKAKEDIEKLRADIEGLQKLRQPIRRNQEQDETIRRLEKIRDGWRNIDSLSEQEAMALRAETDRMLKEPENEQLLDEDTITGIKTLIHSGHHHGLD